MAEDALYACNRDRDGSSAVHWAAAHGNTATLEKALKHRLVMNEGSQVSSNASPLLIAVKSGQNSAVNWLLDHGADLTLKVDPALHCRDHFIHGVKTSILHIALCLGHASTAHLLISRGAPLEYPSASLHYHQSGTTDALVEASFYGLDTVVEVLVKDHGMSPQVPRGSDRDDVLACAATNNNDVSTIRTLVALGANVDGVHKEWDLSPLHVALDSGNFAIARTLLDLGAKINSYHYETDVEIEGEEGISCETIQVKVAPLHDTIASTVPPSDPFYDYSLEDTKRWCEERTAFIQRLVNLGIDIDAKFTGLWAGVMWNNISPLGLASAIADVKADDVAYLIALGAKVESGMVQDALKGAHEEGLKKIKLLLKHGARLDEPLPGDLTMLEFATEPTNYLDGLSTLH